MVLAHFPCTESKHGIVSSISADDRVLRFVGKRRKRGTAFPTHSSNRPEEVRLTSPVFDETGKVIGVVKAKLVEGELLNFAVPSNALAKLLNEKKQILFAWGPVKSSRPFSSGIATDGERSAKADGIFRAAAEAAGTCSLQDASWEYSELNLKTFKTRRSKNWQLKNVASLAIRSGLKDKQGMFVDVSYGQNAGGRWVRDPSGIRKSDLQPEDRLDSLSDNWYLFCPSIAAKWKDAFVEEDSLENEVFQKEPAYRVTVRDPYMGSRLTFWFSRKSNLLIGQERIIRTAVGIGTELSRYSDFRKTSGRYTIPFTINTITPTREVRVLVENLRTDIGLSEYFFYP